MIDWHCHILPGLDDGPSTPEEAIEIAVALRAAGFTRVYCTPHLIRRRYETDNAAVIKGVAQLQTRLDALRIELALFPGREYYLDEYLSDYLKDPLPLGESRYLLIEIPDHSLPALVIDAFGGVLRTGYIPLIAHPERCRFFEPAVRNGLPGFSGISSLFGGKKPKPGTTNSQSGTTTLLDTLRAMGCKFQGDLGSFAGLYGERVKKNALWLKNAGIYDCFGTDAHAAFETRYWGNPVKIDY
jgi:protein-tyrosine phosphatase